MTAVDLATKDLKRPVQALLAAGMLRTEGQRRGTTYWATAEGVEGTLVARGGREGEDAREAEADRIAG